MKRLISILFLSASSLSGSLCATETACLGIEVILDLPGPCFDPCFEINEHQIHHGDDHYFGPEMAFIDEDSFKLPDFRPSEGTSTFPC